MGEARLEHPRGRLERCRLPCPDKDFYTAAVPDWNAGVFDWNVAGCPVQSRFLTAISAGLEHPRVWVERYQLPSPVKVSDRSSTRLERPRV